MKFLLIIKAAAIEVRAKVSAILIKAVERPKVYLFYTSIIFFIFFALFSSYGLVTRIRLEIETASIQSKIDELNAYSNELDIRIKKAEEPEEVEKISREMYSFSLKGEVIYAIE